MTLEDYFKLIVKPPVKEATMFDTVKAKWTEWAFKIKFLLSTPISFEETVMEKPEGWAFTMSTGSYITEDGEFIAEKHTTISDLNEGTWLELVDQILDVVGEHYGYNIKEQVYYSVEMPINIEGEAGYGRSLNDTVLQKLLLSYPEVYDYKGHIEQ